MGGGGTGLGCRGGGSGRELLGRVVVVCVGEIEVRRRVSAVVEA